jgi:hypothetical protein
MLTHAASTFKVKSWDEKPYQELEGGAKFTRAAVTYLYEGDVTGEGTVEYLMFYPGDGTATYTGLERLVGSVGGKSGSFVLQHNGGDDGSAARTTTTVVAGSGTGELRGLRGTGSVEASHNQPKYPATLDYDLD